MPLDATACAAFEAENATLAGQAMRELALARRDIPARDFDPGADLMGWANELVLAGLAGIIDPPRPEARDAIRLCKMAGIQVKMITGDHALTASAIAAQIGIGNASVGRPQAMTGRELAALGDEEVIDVAGDISVFARV